MSRTRPSVGLALVVAASCAGAGDLEWIAVQGDAEAETQVLAAPGDAGLQSPARPNLARRRPVAASSVEAAAFAVGGAVDGNLATRWSSRFSDPQWISVDLGSAYAVSRVLLVWERAFATAYQVQVSNDAVRWYDVYRTTAGRGGTEDLVGLGGHGRYVRVLGTARGTPYGISLWELEIYGEPWREPGADAGAVAPADGGVASASDVGAPASAYRLPADRVVPWQGNVGVAGDVPIRTTICAALSPTGSAATDTSAIQRAIEACPGGQVVALAAGSFALTAPINVKQGVTLRGAGMGATILRGVSGMSGRYLLGAGGTYAGLGASVDLVGGLAKGSTVLTTRTAHGWHPGDLVLIDHLVDPQGDPVVTNVGNNGLCRWCGREVGTQYRSAGQIAKVVATTTYTATLEVPLYWTYEARLAPQALEIQGATRGVGIEKLTVDNSASGNGAQVDNNGTIRLWAASESWLLEVEEIGHYQTGVLLGYAYRNTVRGCRIHEGINDVYGPSRSYGLRLTYAASANLVENNAIFHAAPGIILNGAISGNVFAFNAITRLKGPSATWNSEAISFHGAHPRMNLFEGNFTESRLCADSVWGSSSHNTFFRNRHAIQPGMTGALWDVDLQRYARSYTFVGNVLGTAAGDPTGAPAESVYQFTGANLTGQASIYRLGYDNDGDGTWGDGDDDPGVATTLLRHGNWDSVHGGTSWNGADSRVLPASLYLPAKPAWMRPSLSWPPIGPDVSPMSPTAPPIGATPFGS